MIIDLCAHAGPYLRRPIGLEAPALWSTLAPFGVTGVYAGRLEALWFENPHDANRLSESLPPAPREVVRVPVLDPSIATWREELDRIRKRGPLAMVRLLPSYHNYTLSDADPLLATLAAHKIIAQIILRIDDPRRHHRLAQVQDVPLDALRDTTTRHPELRILLAGAQGPALQSLIPFVETHRNLWADTAQADGVDTIANLVNTPWRNRLVFASHAPIFITEASLARIVFDLDDAASERVLFKNARVLLGLS